MAAQRKHTDVTYRAHLLLAIMSLALAGVAYCAPNLLDRATPPVVFSATPTAMQEVRYTNADQHITLLCEQGQVAEVQVGATNSNGAPSAPVLRYRPSDAAQAMLARMAPLRSQRSLGQQDDAHLKSFGLIDAQAPQLHLKADDTEMTLTLGRALYGTGDLYATAPERGVFVLSPFITRDFDRDAGALWDAHVLDPKQATALRMTVSGGGKRRSFVRSEDHAQGLWSPEGPQQASQAATTHLPTQLIEQLRTLVFVNATAQMPEGSPDIVVELGDDAPEHAALANLRLYAASPEPKMVASYPLTPVILGRAAADGLRDAVAELLAVP